MAKRIKATSKGQPRIRDTGSKQHVDPAAVAKALSAETISAAPAPLKGMIFMLGRDGSAVRLRDLAARAQQWCWQEWQIPLGTVTARKSGKIVSVTVRPEGGGPFRPTQVVGFGAVVRLVGLLVDGEDQIPSPYRADGFPLTASGDPLAPPVRASEAGGICVRAFSSRGANPEIVVRLLFEKPGKWQGTLIGVLKVRTGRA